MICDAGNPQFSREILSGMPLLFITERLRYVMARLIS
jgi:hypothetical protein